MGATREPQVVETCPNGKAQRSRPGAPKTGYPLRGAKIRSKKSTELGSEERKKVEPKASRSTFWSTFLSKFRLLRSNMCFKTQASKVSEVNFGKYVRKSLTRTPKSRPKKVDKKSTFDSLVWASRLRLGLKTSAIVGIMPLPLLTAACRVPVDKQGSWLSAYSCAHKC